MQRLYQLEQASPRLRSGQTRHAAGEAQQAYRKPPLASGQAGQAVQAWSSGFLPVACIMPLQNVLSSEEFCDIMS
jgi:hypothetical protein